MLEVLLLGATGQLGRALRTRLEALPSVRLHCPPRAHCDLRDSGQIATVIRETAPGLVINAAAVNDIDGMEHAPEPAWRVNARAPACMAQTLRALGHGHLLHFSTDYVFDGSATRPYREDATAAPRSAYARSKWAAEQALRASGAPHTIIRIGWLFSGQGDDLLSRTLARLLDAQRAPTFVDDQYGTPTDCATVAGFVAANWLPRLSQASGATCLHLRCAGSTSRYGFARAVQDALRTAPDRPPHWSRPITAVPHTHYPASRLRPRYSVLSDARTRAVFDYRPPTWRSALRATLRDLRPFARPTA